MTSVSIIIVNWNGRKYLPALFSSLYNMDYRDFEIIFVDNGSKDDSVKWVKEHYPYTIIIRNKKNLGFAHGNNMGIKYALRKGVKYIALLNTDMTVEKNWLGTLVNTMEVDKKIGVVGSKIVFMDYPWLINSTGITVNIDLFSKDRDFGRVNGEIERGYGEVLGISAGAMLIRSDVFKKIGLFDKSFFTYCEDTEISLRIRRYTDYKIVYNPDAVVYHKFWGTSHLIPGKREFFGSKNHYKVMFHYLPLREMPVKVLRILKVRCERHLYFEDILHEWIVFLSASLSFISIMIKRLMMDIRYKIRYNYLNMLENTKGIPLGIPFPPDYAERRKNLFLENLPSQIIFGINDNFIGQGWSILIEKDGIRGRKIACSSAEVYLSSPKIGKLFLQMHLFGSNYVSVYFEGKMIGKRKLNKEWETLIFPIYIKNEKKYYEIKIEGKDTFMDEISLLEPSSVLLRRKG